MRRLALPVLLLVALSGFTQTAAKEEVQVGGVVGGGAGQIVGDVFETEAVVQPHGMLHPSNLSFRMAFVVVVIFIGLVFIFKPVLPGKLVEQGIFNCEDPHLDYDNPTSLGETIKGRRRDFARILDARRDLWLFSEHYQSLGALLPIEVEAGFDGSDDAVAKVYGDFKDWLKATLSDIPGGTWHSGQRGLGWPVIDRVVHTVCVSPEYEFLKTYKVEPATWQSKWVMLISKKGCVRIAWYAFITDKVKPGMKSGPFFVRMVTEDLNTDKKATWTEFFFHCSPTGKKDIKEVIAKDLTELRKAIETDEWDHFCPY